MKYYPASNGTSQEGQLRWALDELPWINATKIAQDCCAVLKFWHKGLRKSPSFSTHISLILLFFLSQMLLFLFFYFSHKNKFFACTPIFNSQMTFLLEKRDLPFISQIITLEWLAGKLCIWAASCFWVRVRNSISYWKGHCRGWFVFSVQKHSIRAAFIWCPVLFLRH